jgi:hypothetical protein
MELVVGVRKVQNVWTRIGSPVSDIQKLLSSLLLNYSVEVNSNMRWIDIYFFQISLGTCLNAMFCWANQHNWQRNMKWSRIESFFQISIDKTVFAFLYYVQYVSGYKFYINVSYELMYVSTNTNKTNKTRNLLSSDCTYGRKKNVTFF